jgi:hypothetical protein
MTAIRAALSLLLLLLAPAAAFAVTVDQIVALSRAGVSETVILALIDRDKTVFSIEPDQLSRLQRDGVSEPVILAMLKSGRDEGDAAATADAALNAAFYFENLDPYPQVAIVGHRAEPSAPFRRTSRVDPNAGVAGTFDTYILPYGVPLPARSRCATALPVEPPPVEWPPATSTRGIFFTPPAAPATGMFFNPQLASACQRAAPAAYRR